MIDPPQIAKLLSVDQLDNFFVMRNKKIKCTKNSKSFKIFKDA